MIFEIRRWAGALALAISFFIPPAAALAMIRSQGPDQPFGAVDVAVTVIAAIVPLLLAVAVRGWLWPEWTRERAVITTLTAQVGCWVLGFPAVLVVGFDGCAHRHANVGVYAGAATTTVVAAYLLASPRRAWLCPLAVVAGAAVAVAVLALLPGAPCET